MTTPNKVYIIEIDSAKSKEEAFFKRDTLGRAILHLALTAEEPVYFHDVRTLCTDNPILLLQCSEAFLKEVKDFTTVGRVRELDPKIKSAPSAALHQRFARVPSNPRPRPPEDKAPKDKQKPKAPPAKKPPPRGPRF